MANALAQDATNPFLAGLVSACSMPMGAFVSMGWHPRHRVVAFLMAFGAGLLLAALMTDLVGTARENGHLVELGLGSNLGSLFHTGVNILVSRN